jgi:hypothetical protein
MRIARPFCITIPYSEAFDLCSCSSLLGWWYFDILWGAIEGNCVNPISSRIVLVWIYIFTGKHAPAHTSTWFSLISQWCGGRKLCWAILTSTNPSRTSAAMHMISRYAHGCNIYTSSTSLVVLVVLWLPRTAATLPPLLGRLQVSWFDSLGSYYEFDNRYCYYYYLYYSCNC